MRLWLCMYVHVHPPRPCAERDSAPLGPRCGRGPPWDLESAPTALTLVPPPGARGGHERHARIPRREERSRTRFCDLETRCPRPRRSESPRTDVTCEQIQSSEKRYQL